jgi:predicted RNA methylase
MKRILKSELDKFYTKPEIAQELLLQLKLNDYDIILDPACGDGAFYNQIKHPYKIGLDLVPEIKGVGQHDFLTWDYSSLTGKILAVTNPPFGKQGALALKFIKRCAEFCDTIAFILPLSYMKDSLKNKIPPYFHLILEQKLPEDSFLLAGENYPVKSVFQIWDKKKYKRPHIKPIPAKGFTYTKIKEKADLAVRRVGVYAGQAFLDVNKSEQSHYFLILDKKSHLKLVLEKLNSKKWEDYTVGPRSIAKSELNEYLNSIIS